PPARLARPLSENSQLITHIARQRRQRLEQQRQSLPRLEPTCPQNPQRLRIIRRARFSIVQGSDARLQLHERLNLQRLRQIVRDRPVRGENASRLPRRTMHTRIELQLEPVRNVPYDFSQRGDPTKFPEERPRK